MSQRVVKETVDKDNLTLTTLLECMQLLLNILEQSKEAISDLNKFAEQQKAPNLLSEEITEVKEILFILRKFEIHSANVNCSQFNILGTRFMFGQSAMPFVSYNLLSYLNL